MTKGYDEFPDTPISIEKAFNILDKKKKKKIDITTPISYANQDDMIKFCEYGITFLKDKRLKALMTLRIRGWSHEQIAHKFGKVDPEIVKALEKEAIARIQNKIHSVQENCIPIVGGK